jgi:hypothetical protein
VIGAGALWPLGLTEREVEAGFRPNIEEITTNVVVTPCPEVEGWFIRGDSTQGTELVATFSRKLYQTQEGIVAQHARIDVEPYFQDEGNAEARLRVSFELYERIGVIFVELDATQDGALVWPRLGWSLHGGGKYTRRITGRTLRQPSRCRCTARRFWSFTTKRVI